MLKEYFGYVDSATKKKFGNSKKNGEKERMDQIKLFKKLKSDSSKKYAFMDVEFQTIPEMIYSRECIDEWRKTQGNTKGLHRGKPDYIAICQNGFYMIELKTNKESAEGGAGNGEHDADFKKLIDKNKENQILVRELQDRLRVMYNYGLLNESCNDWAKSILDEEDVKKLSVEAKHLFITNEHFTEEQCRKLISKIGIDEKDVIFEDKCNL